MCFKNLPIEFDSNGKAKLLESAGDPYGIKDAPIKQYVSRSATGNSASRNGSSSNRASANAGSAASTTPPRMSGWATN